MRKFEAFLYSRPDQRVKLLEWVFLLCAIASYRLHVCVYSLLIGVVSEAVGQVSLYNWGGRPQLHFANTINCHIFERVWRARLALIGHQECLPLAARYKYYVALRHKASLPFTSEHVTMLHTMHVAISIIYVCYVIMLVWLPGCYLMHIFVVLFVSLSTPREIKRCLLTRTENCYRSFWVVFLTSPLWGVVPLLFVWFSRPTVFPQPYPWHKHPAICRALQPPSSISSDKAPTTRYLSSELNSSNK